MLLREKNVSRGLLSVYFGQNACLESREAQNYISMLFEKKKDQKRTNLFAVTRILARYSFFFKL